MELTPYEEDVRRHRILCNAVQLACAMLRNGDRSPEMVEIWARDIATKLDDKIIGVKVPTAEF